MIRGLKKANVSRVRMFHSNVQGFSEGPPATMDVLITKFRGESAWTFTGSWTGEDIEHFGELTCRLNDDLTHISYLTLNEDFQQSLRRS